MRRDAHAEIAGREERVLAALGIAWKHRGHIHCPFPDHGRRGDKRPSWRWGKNKKGEPRWFCTCEPSSGSIFDAVILMGRAHDYPSALRFAFGDPPPMPSGTDPKLHKAADRKIEQRKVRHVIVKRPPARSELRRDLLGLRSAIYPYPVPDAFGIYGVVARYQMAAGKTILPWLFDGQRWINKRAPNPWPPYRATSFEAPPPATVPRTAYKAALPG
jgi:hypothetical protein